MIKFKEVVHYHVDDTDCCGDYYRIEIFKDGVLVAQYGDQYHDKGAEKSEGFFEAVRLLLGSGNEADSAWTYDYVEVADEE
jgi:hypothetical protein